MCENNNTHVQSRQVYDLCKYIILLCASSQANAPTTCLRWRQRLYALGQMRILHKRPQTQSFKCILVKVCIITNKYIPVSVRSSTRLSSH